MTLPLSTQSCSVDGPAVQWVLTKDWFCSPELVTLQLVGLWQGRGWLSAD